MILTLSELLVIQQLLVQDAYERVHVRQDEVLHLLRRVSQLIHDDLHDFPVYLLLFLISLLRRQHQQLWGAVLPVGGEVVYDVEVVVDHVGRGLHVVRILLTLLLSRIRVLTLLTEIPRERGRMLCMVRSLCFSRFLLVIVHSAQSLDRFSKRTS